ncbi:MAG: HdeD family acid-resistance protein [Flavobacteriaceae bacterium]
MMVDQKHRAIQYWWVYLVLGLLLIVLSVFVMSTPLESFLDLIALFSIYVFINGSCNISFAIATNKMLEDWGWHFAYGCLELIIGVLLLTYPGIDMITGPIILGLWLIFNAAFLMGISFELRKYGYRFGEISWSVILYFSIILGILSIAILLTPHLGTMTVIGWISLALVVLGLANVILSFKLHYIRRYSMNQAIQTKTFFRERIEELKIDIKDYNDKKDLDYRLDVFIAELENRVMED